MGDIIADRSLWWVSSQDGDCCLVHADDEHDAAAATIRREETESLEAIHVEPCNHPAYTSEELELLRTTLCDYGDKLDSLSCAACAAPPEVGEERYCADCTSDSGRRAADALDEMRWRLKLAEQERDQLRAENADLRDRLSGSRRNGQIGQ